MKVALITGITGQDGSYLTELLLEMQTKAKMSCLSLSAKLSEFNTKHVSKKN